LRKGKNHLNSNVTRIKQYMAERNTILTAEDISDSLGLTKSYTYTILDLMQALDVVDKVKRGLTYYYLKGEHGEEQLREDHPGEEDQGEGIEGEGAASSVGEWLYLERINLREVK
jgi:hypothetical protein